MSEQIIIEELSGIRAKDYIARLSQYHRIQASDGFAQAIDYLSSVLKDNGLKPEIHKYVANGKTRIETWTLPWGWEADYATLHIIEPINKKIGDYKAIPLSLIVHSRDTDTIAEVVYVEEGVRPENYQDKDVKGKIVLAYGESKYVIKMAQQFGAIGLIKFPSTERTQELNDLIQYQAFWPIGDEGKEKTTFGFSISQSDAYEIIDMLKKGKTVKVHAKVKARLKQKDLIVATTLIEGVEKSQEVHIIAHICHPKPGANDNASGAALILEIATTLNRLITEGKLQRPKRSIRFIWVPEMFGTIAYMDENKDILNKTLCTINADMVGQNQFLCRSKLNLIETPLSLPSFLNSLMAEYITKYADNPAMIEKGGTKGPLVYRFIGYSGGSDHFMYDDATIGIPAVMLLQWPDIYYHSTLDTVDKSDATALKWIGTTIAVAAYEIANADKNKAIEFAETDFVYNMNKIFKTYEKLVKKLKKGKISIDTALKIMNFILDNTIKSIQSVNRLETVSEQEISPQIELIKINVEKIKKTLQDKYSDVKKELSELEQKASNITPKRKFKYPLNLTDIIFQLEPNEIIRWIQINNEDKQFHNKIYELCNFMDGKRTLLEIVELVRMEFGNLELAIALDFVETLKTLKLVYY